MTATTQFDPNRADAMRLLLSELPSATRSHARPSLRWGASIAALSALLGAGAATTAYAATGTFAWDANNVEVAAPNFDDAIPAPAGVEPGTPVLVALDEPFGETVAGDSVLDLTNRPESANHVRVTVTPLPNALGILTGSVTYGTDAAGNNPMSYWDGGTGGAITTDVPIDDESTALYVSTSDNLRVAITAQYVELTPTQFGTNAAGQTYGYLYGPTGTPDLGRLEGTTSDGAPVTGYVVTADYAAINPDETVTLPLFDVDGTTEVGTIVINP